MNMQELTSQVEKYEGMLAKLSQRKTVSRDEFEPLRSGIAKCEEEADKFLTTTQDFGKCITIRKIINKERVTFYLTNAENELRNRIAEVTASVAKIRKEKVTYSATVVEYTNKLDELNVEIDRLEAQATISLSVFNALNNKLIGYRDAILCMKSDTRTEERKVCHKMIIRGQENVFFTSAEESKLRKYLMNTMSKLSSLTKTGKIAVGSKNNQVLCNVLNTFPVYNLNLVIEKCGIKCGKDFIAVEKLRQIVTSPIGQKLDLGILRKVTVELVNEKRERISFNKLFERCIIQFCMDRLKIEFTPFCKEFATFKTKAFIALNIRES